MAAKLYIVLKCVDQRYKLYHIFTFLYSNHSLKKLRHFRSEKILHKIYGLLPVCEDTELNGLQNV